MANEDRYVEHDEFLELHQDDPSLKPMVFRLPEPPDLKLIAGYGKPIEDQRFERMVVPPRLKYLEREALRVLKEENTKANFTVTPYKIQKKFWELFEQNEKKYKPEIAFIKKIWWHRLHGYWFYNRGKPTYITGWHFMFLNFWHMADVQGGHPDYRDRDRKEFLYFTYTYKTKETFAKLDEKGYGVPNEDGSYNMVDVDNRTSYGAVQSKNRRSGNTNKGFCSCDEIATRTVGMDVALGTMSYTSKNAGSLFKDKLVKSYFVKPLWMSPFTTSLRNTQETIHLDVVSSDYEYKGLKTLMDYASTASPKYYDSKKMAAAMMEEEGKCFGYGTRIKMFDNSIKEVQNIVVGDVLMGDDSKPRNVLKLARGREEMFEVTPKKGNSWTCNKSHILSLRCSYNSGVPGKKKGDKFDVELSDYLKFSDAHKRASMLYMVGIDHEEKKHGIVSPYFLGLWLGDGHRAGCSITNVDEEVIDYLKDYSDDVGVNMRKDGIIYHLSQDVRSTYIAYNDNESITFNDKKEAASHFGVREVSVDWSSRSKMEIKGYRFRRERKSNLTSELKHIGVLKNKHIPDEYLYDSRENRLQLLAGLIDSDGSINKAKNAYEITQVRKELTFDIKRLVSDLGFYCSVSEKKTSMKRDDGSMYHGHAYRIKIHGKDLHEIPCKVERKQTYNRMNNRHYVDSTNIGFDVKSIGEGDYYGFVIDGNKRFLLEDNVVAHNTDEVNISERWGVVKLCLSQGNGKIIHGWSYHPSTVEETSSNSADFKFLIASSDFYRRIKSSGQTYSGLMRLFVPGDEGLDGYIDSYGYSVKGDILDYQKKEGFTQTSTEFLTDQRESYLREGDMEKYRGEKKRFPLKFADSWLGDAGSIGFDIEKIDKRLEQLSRHREWVKGNFEWVDGRFGGDVYWVPDEANGRFEMALNPPESMRNKKVQIEMYSVFKGAVVPMYRPASPDVYVLGADPFGFSNKQQAAAKKKKTGSSNRGSDGGLAVYWKYDDSIDGGKPRNEWETARFILSYRYRLELHEYNEDALKAAIYCGAMVYPETNKESTYQYFIEHGFGGYLLYDVDMITGKLKEKPGVFSLERSKTTLFSLIKEHIALGCEKEAFDLFLQECKDINGTEEMTFYDRLTAHGLALMGAKSTYPTMFGDNDVYNQSVDLDDIIDEFWV